MIDRGMSPWDEVDQLPPGAIIRLWLDDERPAPDGWLWAKSAWQAKYALSTSGIRVERISLDHDLGMGETGYDVATYLEERCILDGYPAPEMSCHSANSVGRVRIEQAFDSIRRRALS